MNIGEILCNNSIAGLSPLEIGAYIENGKYINSGSGKSLVIVTDKYIPIKCIGEYYSDPITCKKVKTTSANNPCHNVGKAFDIETSNGCQYCHRVIINKFLNNEVNLLKKYNKKKS